MIENENGIMQVITSNKTTLEKELNKLKGLEELLEQDKKNNDDKSIKYHTLAIEETKKKIDELKNDCIL